jgi:polyhydroxyalkanoate depolymerase
MLYAAYQTADDLMLPLRVAAGMGRLSLLHLGPYASRNLQSLSAAYEMLAETRLTHSRPAFGITTAECEGRTVPVREEAACTMPFGTLLRFAKEGVGPQPRVLLVAPLSGHFATLLRATVETLLPEHDVYLTDWHNARDIPTAEGRFGLDEYTGHLLRFLEAMGPGAHVIAVCQSCVPAMAAAAIAAEDGSDFQPLTLTLMAGPVDARANPTKVNELAMTRPIGWFERNLIAWVPARFPGSGRRVYPGFVQLTAFMSMNINRHVKAHVEMYESLMRGDRERAGILKAFYEEYFAVLDLSAEFYLETVQRVFQEHHLALGKYTWRDRKVEPRAIKRTALLTIEGERDDICALGQTSAAHDLCSGLRPYMKRHHLQPGVGHYGVFSGKRWTSQIYPIVRHVIQSNDRG